MSKSGFDMILLLYPFSFLIVLLLLFFLLSVANLTVLFAIRGGWEQRVDFDAGSVESSWKFSLV
jgi:hypothetical protein